MYSLYLESYVIWRLVITCSSHYEYVRMYAMQYAAGDSNDIDDDDKVL